MRFLELPGSPLPANRDPVKGAFHHEPRIRAACDALLSPVRWWPQHGDVSTRTFLIVFATGFVSIFLVVGGVLFWAFDQKGFVSSPGIDLAVALVRGDPRVVQALGESFEIEQVRGGVGSSAHNASVEVEVGLAGPRGKADLTIVGFRIGQTPWVYPKLELRTGAERMDFSSAE